MAVGVRHRRDSQQAHSPSVSEGAVTGPGVRSTAARNGGRNTTWNAETRIQSISISHIYS